VNCWIRRWACCSSATASAQRRLKNALKRDAALTRDSETRFVRRLNRMRPKIEPWLLNQLDVLAIERDLLQSTTTLIELTREHVLNEHNPPSARALESLAKVRLLFQTAFAELAAGSGQETRTAALRKIDTEIDRLTERILEDLYDGSHSPRNTSIMLGIALETRDLSRELQRATAS
jgi:hypothetical protein